MASIQSRILTFWFRQNKYLANKKYTPPQMRERMEQSQRFFKLHKDVQNEAVQAGSVPAEWSIPNGAPGDAAILYIHGGAWYMGSPRTHRGMVSHLCYASGVNALSIDYRLAPENPFPAGLEDCLTAFEWLQAQGIPARRIVLAGDSAGGNLSLALLVELKAAGKPLPAGAVALSPATDLASQRESYTTRHKVDPVLANLGSTSIVSDYIRDHDPHEPTISPIYADLQGLPPILIHVGENEVLLDDAVGFVARARAAGVEAQVKVWPEMFHVFQIFVPWLPEARQAISEIGEFIRARIRTG
ncbi:MAG: alpha/beta hydrolase [Anaerolineales bacterium]|nr:alpha/beta hydrolase [Anaerolineae bacterium]PWB49780.1 MAG: alpha/beta hydrolase [Anaerolineales bacterium]